MTARHLSAAGAAALTVAVTLALSVTVRAEDGDDRPSADDRHEHRDDFKNRRDRAHMDRPMRGPHKRRSGPQDRSLRPQRPPQRDLTPDEVEERMRILREIHPQLAERIARMKEERPERVGRMLGQHWPRIENFIRMKEHDPKGFELRVHDMKLTRQSHELSRRMRRPDSDPATEKKEEIRHELRELVATHFEVRQKLKEHELAKLETRIEELRGQLRKRATNKEQIIEDHFKKLSGQSDADAW